MSLLSITLYRRFQQPMITKGILSLLFCSNTRSIRFSDTHESTNSLIARILCKVMIYLFWPGQCILPTNETSTTSYAAVQSRDLNLSPTRRRANSLRIRPRLRFLVAKLLYNSKCPSVRRMSVRKRQGEGNVIF